jgi:hypothetical protein
VNPVNPSTGPEPWPPYPAGWPAYGPARAPLTVSVASVLLVVAAAVALLPLVSVAYDLTHVEDLLRRAAERTGAGPAEVDRQRTAHRIVSGVAVAVVLLTSAALLVPALSLRRGSPVARVLSCVTGVSAALCCCTGYGVSALGQGSSGGTELASEVSRLSVRETPLWVALLSMSAALLVPLAMTAVVLLLVPPSNRFFRPSPSPPPQDPGGGYYVYPAQWWSDRPGGPDRPPDGPRDG